MPASVSIYQGPPAQAWTTVYEKDTSGNTLYTGQARSVQSPKTLTVTSISKANPAVVTVTGHGLGTDNPVVIAGATEDWAGVNGEQIITVTGDDTFTIPVDTSAYSGDFDGAITTTAPRAGDAIWSISKNYPGATSDRSAWAAGTPVDIHIWANRASLKYQ